MGSANAYFLLVNFATFFAFSAATFCCGYSSYGYGSYAYPTYAYSPYAVTYPTQYVRIPIYAIVRRGSYPASPSNYATSPVHQDEYAAPEMTSSYRSSRPSDEILAGYAASPKYTLEHNAADSEDSFRSLPSSPEEEASGMFSSSSSSSADSTNFPTNSGDTSHKPYEFTSEDSRNTWRRLRLA
uniref:Secreted mucin n=1 Tax=Steinernema glaseri TaxID=37863 RepID=A0A1I7YRN5_9BILA